MAKLLTLDAKDEAKAQNSEAPTYLFLKQSADFGTYFSDICMDIPRPGMAALVISEICDKTVAGVRFQSGPRYRRDSYLARVTSWMSYLLVAASVAFRTKGNPLLFIVAQPPVLPMVGYLQHKLFGHKYVVWIDDLYPDVLVRKGVLRADGRLTRLWGAFNRLVLAHSEHVFTLGPHMLAATSKYLHPGVPATVVPTWVDTDIIRPIPRSQNEWAKAHDLVDKFTIMYSGNFGETHEVDSLLEAANRLRLRADLHFLLVGAGAKWESIRMAASEQARPNITVLPWQPKEVLPKSLSSADVSFVSLGEGIEGVSMPSKTYNAMAAGSAIIASCAVESDLAEVVRNSECGVVVRPHSVDDIVNAIEHLSSHAVELAAYKANARTAAVLKYSRNVHVERMRGILEQIADKDNHSTQPHPS